MNNTIRIYGKDYSKIIYGERDADGNGIEYSFDSSRYKKEEQRTIKNVVAKLFLQDIETNKRYHKLVENGDAKAINNKLIKEFHIVDPMPNSYFLNESEEDGKFFNIIGVLKDSHFKPEENRFRAALTECGLNIESIEKAIDDSYDITIQIGSRFDGEKAYLLSTMLMCKPPKHIQDLLVPSNEDELFGFMLLIWLKEQLKDAYITGIYRSYTQFKNNDSRLRGAIDIARHIKHNAGQNNGCIAYNVKENTPDNALNHLILFAHDVACRRYYSYAKEVLLSDREYMKIIGEVKVYAPSWQYTNAITTMNKCRRSISHPYYHLYEKLRETCIKILQFSGLSMFDGTEDDTQGILFYVPDLWEDFLYECFKDNKINVRTQEELYVFIKNETGKKKGHSTFPDYVIYSDEYEPFMILDAKYKKGWTDSYKNENCILSDYDECIRNMNTIRAHATGVVFPTKDNLPIDSIHNCHSISDRNTYDRFYSFPILIPNTNNRRYSEWIRMFEENIEESLIQTIVPAVKNEEMRSISINNLKNKLSNCEVLNEEEKLAVISLL